MENMLLVASVAQGVAVSLGVGTSTMAIVNFFGAIADGKIDEAERRMMGFTYFVLRVAMIVILLTILASFSAEVMTTGTLALTTSTVATIVLVSMLYINAILMTVHIMPSTFGPALQASSWYTLGIMASLSSLGLVTFGILPFLLGYASVFLLAVALVNGTMAIMKHKRESVPTKPPVSPTPTK